MPRRKKIVQPNIADDLGISRMSAGVAEFMADLSVRQFSDEQLMELATGDVYADTVRDLGFDPLGEHPLLT